jgi:hypothetical protein
MSIFRTAGLRTIHSGFRELGTASVGSSSAFPDLGFHAPRMVVGGHDGRALARGRFAREDLKAEFLFPVEKVERVVQVSPDDEIHGWPGECIGTFEDSVQPFLGSSG